VLTVPDQGTIVLYVLSTLAQTCAALAAFVGAVGIFYLQVLRDEGREKERELRILSDRLGTIHHDVMLVPMREILHGLDAAGKREDIEATRGTYIVSLRAALEARQRWAAFRPRLARSRERLIAFEAWNLLVIGASLIGFNYVPALASCRWTFWAVWAAGMGTVAVTAYCVFAWTKE